MSKKLTIELSDELATFAQAKVTAGEYESLDEAIAAGVRNLQDHDAVIEQWIREKVIPAYDEWLKNPDDVLTADEVFDSINAELDAIEAKKAS
jgi:antitoxin ParD1/3/4